MVSILIPVYNASQWIAECMDSIFAQTLSDWECIIVDDGSTDDTLEKLDQYKDNRLHIFRQKKQGIVSALNLGLHNCNYPLIARMDADDRMPSDRLKLQAEYLHTSENTGLVSGQVQLFSEMPDSRGYRLYVDWINTQSESVDLYNNRFVESPFAHPSVMFRKSLIEKYGAYRQGAFPEDYELWLRWMQAGVKMEKLPELVLYWRDHEKRLSRTHKQYSVEAFQEIKVQYLVRYIHEKLSGKNIWIWGAGKVARTFVSQLEAKGIIIEGMVEVDQAKVGGKIIYYKDLGRPDSRFIISLVGSHGARDEIRAFLEKEGWVLGLDFILAS